MLLAILGLDFWESSVLIFVLLIGALMHLAQKAASNPIVQKGAGVWLGSFFK